MKVWIDQDLCTGDGLCPEIAPAVFVLAGGGPAYVAVGGVRVPGEGVDALALVPDELLEATIESADECPGECIFIEVE